MSGHDHARLRVLTWNLHGTPNPGGAATPEQQAQAWAYLAAVDADLILLQEVGYAAIPAWAETRWSLVRAEVDRHGKRKPWGSVIGARAGLDLQEPEHLDDDATLVRLYTAGVTVGSLTLPDGARAAIASVHAAASKPASTLWQGRDLSEATGFARQDLLRPGVPESEPMVVDLIFCALARHARGRRFLFAGDWNIARSFGPDQRAFFDRAAAAGWVDGHALRQGEEVATFYPRGHTRQLDHLFMDADTATALATCEVVQDPACRSLSDHAPILAELHWPPPPDAVAR